jgi:hypothetical protein
MSDPDPAAAVVVDDYSHISHALGRPVPAKIVRTDDGRRITCRLAFKEPDPKVAVLLNIISAEEAAAIIDAGTFQPTRGFSSTVTQFDFCSRPQAAPEPRGWARND